MLERQSERPRDTDPQRLFDNERRFRLLVEGVVDYAIYMLDPNGIVANWNAGAQRIKGYTADEIVGQHFSIFYSPEEKAAGIPARALETALREGKFEAEAWRVRKDGSRFFASVVIDPIYENGVLVGFGKITRDITERRKAQDSLLESERQFKRLVSGVTDYALYMLDPEGNVSSWNAGGERIKGYAPSEIIGRHFSQFYTDTDRQNGRPRRALSIAKETGRYEEEGWRVRKDGTFFWASVVIDSIRDDDGNLIGFAKITRDISERRETQLALERIQKQLAESQKIEALGQLTGGVAHDFNNLLMIVSGHVETLKRYCAGDPKSFRAAQAIEIAAQRGATLTRQLLTFARRQAVDPKPVNLHERIEAIREVLSSGSSGVDLLIDIPPGVWPVIVDVSEFEIAIVNLLVNARDAMQSGGTVTITAANTVIDGKGTLAKGDYVVLSVADSGVGIPEDILGGVFQPFFTTKPPGKGTGLGLSQVHGFAHQAGGTVEIASTFGVGTTVTLYLPRAQMSGSFGANETGAVEHSGVVLLVEDNPDVADATSMLLQQLGYSVRWVSDADSALLEIKSEEFDLVLSDIVMPGRLDGLGLARAIQNERPGLAILLATGYSDAALTVRTDFPILKKPYQIHELSRAIADVMPRRGFS
jgi:PAS domain S-box-containing protein